MSQLPRKPMMIDPITGLPIPGDPGVDPTMGFPTPASAPPTGLLGRVSGAFGGPQGLLGLGANLMAASGPSPTRQNFGSILGQSLLANQQQQQQNIAQALQMQLVKSQILKNSRGTGTTKQQDYEYAKSQGFEGSFEEFLKVGSAQPQRPGAIEEYEYWKSLPTKAEKDAYLTIKRNMQPFQLGEAGGGKIVFNRATGQWEQATTAEQEATGAATVAGATAGAKTTGEATAEAKLDLPRIEQNTQQALQTVSQLKKHPGLPYITGLYSAAPIIPGTPQAGANALMEQIQGKTFLEAYQTLRGGGQITEVEGTKAEAAIARLQRSQNRRDVIQALDELTEVLNVGLERARKMAGGGTVQTSGAPRVRVDAQGNVIR